MVDGDAVVGGRPLVARAGAAPVPNEIAVGIELEDGRSALAAQGGRLLQRRGSSDVDGESAGGRLPRRVVGDLEDERAGADAGPGAARQRQPGLIARHRPGRTLRGDALGHDVEARVATMDDPDVILGIDGHPDRLAEHPVIGQRPGPQRVDLEGGRLDAGGALCRGDPLERAARSEQGGDEHDEKSPENGMTPGSHVRPPAG